MFIEINKFYIQLFNALNNFIIRKPPLFGEAFAYVWITWTTR